MDPASNSAAWPWHVLLARFFDRHPWIADSAGAALLGYFAWIGTASYAQAHIAYQPFTVSGLWQAILAVTLCAPLAVRRVWPVAAGWVMATVGFVSVILLIAPAPYHIAVPIMVYSVSCYSSPAWGRTFLLLGMAGSLLAGLQVGLTSYWHLQFYATDTATNITSETLILAVLATSFCAVCVVLAWLLGDVHHRRMREIQAVTEHNRLLLREREHEARLAADAERMRIAREMHDIVSHSMSVMIAQADGGRFVLGSARGADGQVAPEVAASAQAFSTIAQTGRDALDQMRRMLGVLRSEEHGAEFAPLPDVKDLPQLIADVRAAGLTVDLVGDPGRVPPLAEGAGLTVYRVVQEALTNTLKHVGTGAHAYVRLRVLQSPPRLQVHIDDDGGAGVAEAQASVGHRGYADGRGSGLVGMRERALMHDGTVHTHADEHGFHVLLELPLPEAPAGLLSPRPVRSGTESEDE